MQRKPRDNKCPTDTAAPRRVSVQPQPSLNNTTYPWSNQSQIFPYGPGLFDNTRAVSSAPPATPIIQFPRVFSGQSDSFISPMAWFVPMPDPTFVAPYVPLNREPALPRGALVSSDQWEGRRIGVENYHPQQVLNPAYY